MKKQTKANIRGVLTAIAIMALAALVFNGVAIAVWNWYGNRQQCTRLEKFETDSTEGNTNVRVWIDLGGGNVIYICNK